MSLKVQASMQTPLMRHQEEGVDFLLGRKRGLLAFEQGLGKTAVAIAAFARLRTAGLADAMLVISPNSLRHNWVAEVQRHAPSLRTAVVGGDRRERLSAIGHADADVVIASYETARAEPLALSGMLSRRRYALVLDESHFAKNHLSKNAHAVTQLASRTTYCWLLSGTPITNTATDLFTQLRIIGAAAQFGSLADFRDRFVPAERGESLAPSRRSELANAIAADVFRRTKAECLDLPPKTFVDIEVELHAWQRKLYVQFRDGLAVEVAGMSQEEFRAFIPTALTRLLRLSQIASNPTLVNHAESRVPAKFEELDRVLLELLDAPSQKVIVWSHYVASIEALARRYASYGAIALHGGVPAQERQRVADRFQQDPELRLLIANPAAAGTGLTLTAATVAVYESLSWRYDLYAQSQDRIHRIGQSMPVTYLRLLATDTVDMSMARALAAKSLLARELIGDDMVTAAFREMTQEQFLALLRDDAVVR